MATLSFRPTFVLLSASLAMATVFTTGCGMGGSLSSGSTAVVTAAAISGKVHGGPTPIVGAVVRLYATQPNGSGGAGVQLGNQAITGPDGGFTFVNPTPYTCPAGQQAYITVAGGDSGAGPNPNILLMAVIGDCSQLSVTLRSDAYVWVNELSTAAAAYALNSFITVSGTTVNVSAPSDTNSAYALARAAVNTGTEVNSVGTSSSPPNGAALWSSGNAALINTLGNILQYCVNSSVTSPNCGSLYAATTPSGGAAPTNTLQAILNIARFPAQNVSQIYGFQPSTSIPFMPALTTSPVDFTMLNFVSSWGAGLVISPPATQDTMTAAGLTYRNIEYMSQGGSSVRLTLSNRYGTEPLTISHVTVAVSNYNYTSGPTDSSIQPGTLQPATFGPNNSPSVTIAAGDTAYSNPVAISFSAFNNLAVSMFVPQQTINNFTDHAIAHQTNYVGPGDQTTASALTGTTGGTPLNLASWHFLSSIDVVAPQTKFAIVCVGDSITDGAGANGADPDGSDRRWPNYLDSRFKADTADYGNISVVNEGIGSDRVYSDGAAESAHAGLTPSVLHRWGYDALARPGVKYIIFIEGVNDIDAAVAPRGPAITAQDLINAYETVITQAHQAGVKVIMGTMTPAAGRSVWTTNAQTFHDTVNAWIRQGTANGYEDGFIDFEKATQDPSNPTMYLPAYNSGDNLHPSDAGKAAMANAIDLTVFQ